MVYRSNLISSSKDLPRLEFEDINSGLGTLNKDISQKLDYRKGLEFNVGDVLFGKLRPYLKNWWYAEFKGIALGDFWNLKSDLWHSCFLYTYIQSNSFQLVANDTSGTKMPRSDWNLVAESIAKFPSLPEQKAIGTFFSTLDQHITLHQRKLDKLKSVKQAYLSEMFPAEGERVPKRRFPGFTDDWELHPLREIGNTYTGLSGKTKDDFGHGDGRFVTYMNVFSNPISLPEMVEEVEFDESQNTVRYGDVLFTTSSETPEEVGMSSVWLENTENTYLNSFCFGFRPVKKVNPYYLAYLLRSSGMRRKISFLAQGISRYNISKTKMMELEISIPNVNEQSAIGTFFSTLDRHITLHQRKS